MHGDLYSSESVWRQGKRGVHGVEPRRREERDCLTRVRSEAHDDDPAIPSLDFAGHAASVGERAQRCLRI